MILYSVTVKIDFEIEKDWLNWMKNIHIPEVMDTGYFMSNDIFKLLIDEPDGITYSIQYKLKNIADLEDYQAKYAPQLQAKHNNRYADKFVAFRTLLEKV